MTRSARLLVAAALLGVAGLAVGCTDEATTLDQAATEHAVGLALADQLEPKVSSTTCPGPLPLGRGETFECEVVLKGDVGTMPVEVTIVDDEGALQVEPLSALLARPDAAVEAKASLKEVFGRSFQVDCGDDAGDGLRVYAPGDTFDCQARDSNSRRTITVTVVDPSAALTFKVNDPEGS